MQLNHIQEKVKKTNISRYNCENVYQNDEIKNKIKNTFLKKYGGHPMKNKIRHNEARKKNNNNYV